MKWVSWVSQLNIGVLSYRYAPCLNIQQILHWKMASEDVYVLKLGGWWILVIWWQTWCTLGKYLLASKSLWSHSCPAVILWFKSLPQPRLWFGFAFAQWGVACGSSHSGVQSMWRRGMDSLHSQLHIPTAHPVAEQGMSSGILHFWDPSTWEIPVIGLSSIWPFPAFLSCLSQVSLSPGTGRKT